MIDANAASRRLDDFLEALRGLLRRLPDAEVREIIEEG
jgi:hypothetical protein